MPSILRSDLDLMEEPAILPKMKSELTFREWSAKTVFSGLPMSKKRHDDRRNIQTKEYVVASPPNSDPVLCGGDGTGVGRAVSRRASNRKNKLQEGVKVKEENNAPSDETSFIDYAVGNGGEISDANKTSIHKNKLLLVAQNNRIKLQEGGSMTDENDPPNERESFVSDVDGGVDTRNDVQKMSILKNKFLQVAAHHSATASDQNDDEKQVVAEGERATRDLMVLSSTRGDRSERSVTERQKVEPRAIVKDETVPYYDWASSVVFSGLPVRSEAKGDSDPSNDKDLSVDDAVIGGGDSDALEKISLHKNQLLLAAAQYKATTPERMNDIGEACNTKPKNKSQEVATDENDSSNGALMSLEYDAVGGAGTRNDVQKMSILKNKFLQVAAQRSTTASDRIDDEKELVDKGERATRELIISSTKGDRRNKSVTERGKPESKATVKDETVPYYDWASSVVFSGLLEKREAKDDNDPSNDKDLAVDDAGRGGSKSSAVTKSILRKNALLLGAELHEATVPGVNNYDNGSQVMKSMDKSREGDTNEIDSPNNESSSLGDAVVGDAGKSNDVQKMSILKNKFLQVAAQRSATASDRNNDEKEVVVEGERATRDLVISSTRGDPSGRSANERGIVESKVIVKDETVPYYDWASSVVFSGLLEKREAEDDNDPSNEKDSFVNDIGRCEGDSGALAKISLHTNQMLLAAAQYKATAPEKMSVIGDARDTKSKENLQEDAKDEHDSPNEKASSGDDAVARGADTRNDVQKMSILKNKFLQVAAQRSVTDQNDDGQQVLFEEIPLNKGTVVSNIMRRDCSEMSANERGKSESKTIGEDETVPYYDWASSVVFSGLLEKREDEERSPHSNDLAGDEVLKHLPAQAHVQEPNCLSQNFAEAGRMGSKSVSFRERDSFTNQKSALVSSGNSTSIAETSVDFDTLLGDEALHNERTYALPSLSETGNPKLEKSVGDLDFTYEESNSSLHPQPSATAGSKTNNFNIDPMGKSFRNADFSYDESNSSLPPQCSAMARPKTGSMASPKAAGFNIDLMEKSIGDLDFSYDDMVKEIQPHDKEPKLLGHPTNNLFAGREKENSLDQAVVSADKTLQQQDKKDKQIKELIQRHIDKNVQKSQSEKLAGANSTSLNQKRRHREKRSQPAKSATHANGRDKDRHQPKVIVPLNENTNGKATDKRKYTIPAITTASAMKENINDRVGLVFSAKSQKIILSSMTPNSLFLNTSISINDELLVINGHRIKNAKKAAEFIRMSHGQLTITAFHGARPKESELIMMRLSGSDWRDIKFFTNNGMVHIIRAGGRFSKSGKIKSGDICLSINGIPVNDAKQGSELIWEASQGDHRPLRRSSSNASGTSDYDFVPHGGLAIILVFSLAKLRSRLIENISTHLPLSWNQHFNECAITLPSGNSHRMLRIHNDGNCEDILESFENIDTEMREDIEVFASTFYTQFQDSMTELHAAMQHAATCR